MSERATLLALAERAERVAWADIPDCQSCGACCRFAGDVTVGMREGVPRYLTRSVRNIVGYASYEAEYLRRMARRDDGACVAFRGEVGGSCSCSIYDRRPEVCRNFAAGTEDCHAALRACAAGDADGQ